MLKGGLVLIWELDMNLVPTLLTISEKFKNTQFVFSIGLNVKNLIRVSLDILNRVGSRFMSSSQINTRPPSSKDIHFAKS